MSLLKASNLDKSTSANAISSNTDELLDHLHTEIILKLSLDESNHRINQDIFRKKMATDNSKDYHSIRQEIQQQIEKNQANIDQFETFVKSYADQKQKLPIALIPFVCTLQLTLVNEKRVLRYVKKALQDFDRVYQQG